MVYTERESHAQGMNPTQDTSRMGITRLRQEEEADTKNNNNYGIKERVKSPKQGIASAKDVTIMFLVILNYNWDLRILYTKP